MEQSNVEVAVRFADFRIGSDGADSVSLSDSENDRGTPDADWARCSRLRVMKMR